MKKLLLLLMVAAAVSFGLRNLPHFSVFRLSQALEKGDLDTVSRLADLNAFSEVPVDLTVELAAAGLKDAAGVLGESLAKLFGVPAGAIAKQIGGPLATQELRRRIQARDLKSLLGGFEVKPNYGWYGGIQMMGDQAAVLTVSGTCPSREKSGTRAEARVGVNFVKVPGALFGFPWDWRASGLEANSLRTIVRDCALRF